MEVANAGVMLDKKGYNGWRERAVKKDAASQTDRRHVGIQMLEAEIC